jgi:hypothetical protein
MYRILFISLIILFCGCGDSVEVKQKKIIDSLQTVIIQDSTTIDSLTNKLEQQRFLMRLTAEKCHKFAVIVKKKPAQSVFIVTWIDRSFLWLDEK